MAFCKVRLSAYLSFLSYRTFITQIYNQIQVLCLKRLTDGENKQTKNKKTLPFQIYRHMMMMTFDCYIHHFIQPIHCCNVSDVTWVSTNLGALLCINCSGAHRDMGVQKSRIQSLELDRIPCPELLVRIFHQFLIYFYANFIF